MALSRIKIALVGFAVATVGLMLSRPEATVATPLAEPVYPRAEISTVARSMIRVAAKDADSLKFRNEFTAQAGIYCGEVNGKNSFGAYAGFKRFIANGKTVLMDDETTKDFGQAWSEFCTPEKSV